MKILSNLLVKAGVIVDNQVAVGTSSPFAGYTIDARGSNNFGTTSSEVYHYFSSANVSGGSALTVSAANLSANSARSHIMLTDTSSSVLSRFGLGVYTGAGMYAYLDSASKLVINNASGANVIIGSTVDSGYKLDVYGDVKGNVFRGANGAPLITFDAATNRVKIDGQGYGSTASHSLIVGDYLSVEARAVFNTLVRVKGSNSVISYGISRPDAPALDAAALSGIGPRFNTLWYTGAGLSFYVSEGADISGGFNVVEKLRLSPNGDFTVYNLAGTGSRMVVADATGILSTQAIPTFTDTNIYNTDGTLTGTRTVSLANNVLSFTGGQVSMGSTTANSAGILTLTASNTRTKSIVLTSTWTYQTSFTMNNGIYSAEFNLGGSTKSAAEGGPGSLAVNTYNSSTNTFRFPVTFFQNGNVAFGGSGTTVLADTGEAFQVRGSARISGLSGSDTRMVVADLNGILGTQSISGGVVLGSGTFNYIAKWSDLSGATLGDSIIYDDGISVGIGTSSPAATAKLDVASTTQGFLPPRMTSAQRAAITSPAAGLVVYQTDGNEGLWLYTVANGWKALAIVV